MGILEHPGMPGGGLLMMEFWGVTDFSNACQKDTAFYSKTCDSETLVTSLQGDQLWGMITYPDGIWSPNHYSHF